MCGLVGVVRRPPDGAPPEPAPLLEMLDAAAARLGVEAAAPFFPEKKPLDAYCACLLDTLEVGPSLPSDKD